MQQRIARWDASSGCNHSTRLVPLTPTTKNTPGILIVDDNADMRFYMRGCLRKLGLKDVLEASNGAEALRMAHENDVALIISDIVMPEMGGYELCRSIKSDPALAGVRVILVSGETNAPPPGTGTDAFLQKPFNTGTLRASVTALLEESR